MRGDNVNFMVDCIVLLCFLEENTTKKHNLGKPTVKPSGCYPGFCFPAIVISVLLCLIV